MTLLRLQASTQTDDVVAKTREIENEKSALLRQEELFWLQRSRINWMREGDQNTAFFHKIASGRRKRNHIQQIKTETGQTLINKDDESFQEIQDCLVNHFSKVFTAKEELHMGGILEAVQRKVSKDMDDMLALPFSELEIEKALFQMHPSKAPGPDETLSANIRREMELGVLHGVKICRQAPVVSQLFFADDTLIFGRATPNELQKIKDLLRRYENASGQQINLGKSEIAFSGGINEQRAEELASLLGVKRVPHHSIYLGIPASVGQSRVNTFQTLVHRVTKKLRDWKARTLSQAGKITLVKAVAQAIPTYLMSCFRIPQSILSKINGAIARFLWGQKDEEKRIHWLRWEKLCKAKRCGGLGLRDMEKFNQALLAKQAWRLVQDESSILAQTLKARYFPMGCFRTATMGYRSSAIWQSILHGRKLLEQGLVWIIGDGRRVNVHRDRWILREGGTHVLTSKHPDVTQTMKVHDLLLPCESSWDVSKVMELFPLEDAELILAIPAGKDWGNDVVAWRFSKNGWFNVRSAYQTCNTETGPITPGTSEQVKWSKIWKLATTHKIVHFIWRILHGILPTAINLTSRFVDVDPICKRCAKEVETAEHAIRDCEMIRQFWHSSMFAHLLTDAPLHVWVNSILNQLDEEEGGIFATTLWYIWWERNYFYFRNKGGSHDVLWRNILTHRKQFKDAWGSDRVRRKKNDNESSSWIPPEEGYIKVNVDASVRGGAGATLGGIARNHLGEGLWYFTNTVERINDVEIAEAMAVERGVELANNLGINKLLVETDSQVVTNYIHNDTPALNYVGRIIHSIKRKIRGSMDVTFIWTRRKANGVAHKLAAMDATNGASFFSYVIPEIIESLVLDEMP